ncbi:MAG TPA: hypothetical protein VFB81_21700 [Myxococcales bacterium]|nr:hypothetical protein [Myxococcales bacterium]
MSKVTMFAAALAAVGVTLFTSSGVLAQPAPEAAALGPSQAEVDRAVERHLGALLQQKLADLREERAWAMGLR